MMQYGHVYTAFCIIIKLKVMFWKLYTRIDFNVGTFNTFPVNSQNTFLLADFCMVYMFSFDSNMF